MTLIAKKEQCGALSGIRICEGALNIHHLLFADDNFLFGKASLDECAVIQHILDVFSQASGQTINFSNSSVAFNANVRSRGAGFYGRFSWCPSGKEKI